MRHQASGMHGRASDGGAAEAVHSIIVVGTSSGGVEALMQLVRGLPRDFPAAIFVVMHVSPQVPSNLPKILNRAGPVPSRHPSDGEQIVPGTIYVAPPDRHLMVERGRVRVVHGPRENRHRPAVDPLFRSAALAYGAQVIGVVLTGALDDGTAGLQAIKQRGGIAIVQDPDDALTPSMPASALEFVKVDYVLAMKDVAPLLVRLAATRATDGAAFPASRALQHETSIAMMDTTILDSEERPGNLVPFSCPECGGPLYETHDEYLVRYRCRVGHAFSGESMLAGQEVALEDALWSAYNTLRDSALVAERMASDAIRRGHSRAAARMLERAALQKQRATMLLSVIGEGPDTVQSVALDEDAPTDGEYAPVAP